MLIVSAIICSTKTPLATGLLLTNWLLGCHTYQNRSRKTPSLGEDLPPLGTIPTTVQEYSAYFKAQVTRAISPILHTQHHIPSQEGYLHSWLQYTPTESTTTIAQLINDIITGKAIAVSDGSFDPITCSTGAAAWTIESKDSSQWIKGTAISPGLATIQNPYRSKILGIPSNSTPNTPPLLHP